MLLTLVLKESLLLTVRVYGILSVLAELLVSVAVIVPVYVPAAVAGMLRLKLTVALLVPAGTLTLAMLGALIVLVPSLKLVLVLDTVIADVLPALLYVTSKVTLLPGSPDSAATDPLRSSAATKAKAIRNTNNTLIINRFMLETP